MTTIIRARLAERAKSAMLRELKKKQHKGDNWLTEDSGTLHEWLAEEFNEVGQALNDYEQEPTAENAAALKSECAHVMICAAFILDWVDNQEKGHGQTN